MRRLPRARKVLGGLVIAFVMLPVFLIAYFFLGAGKCRGGQSPLVPTAPVVAGSSNTQKLPVKVIEANGLKFAYITEGQGPLVILLHGFPETAHTWEGVMPALARAHYHAVAIFMRGYYPTDIPADGDYSAETMGNDVLAVTSAFGEKRAILIGHDWGATVAMAAANLAPERIEKLVTVGIPPPRVVAPTPTVLNCMPHFVIFQFGSLAEWWSRRNDFAYIKHLYAYWSPRWRVPEAELSEIETDFSRPGRLRAAIQYYHFGAADQLEKQKTALYNKTISVPTLAFAGKDDLIWQLGLFDHIASAFSGPFELVAVDHAGHFLQLEQPKLFRDKLLEFLRS